MNPTDRIMALDLGEKRIGVALCDETKTIARSFGVIQRTSRAADFKKLKQILKENDVNLVIVGLPTLASGGEGTKAAWARSYAGDLADQCDIDVELWDESYSTVDAIASLRSRGIRGNRQRQKIDAVAAAFILQSYLDAVVNRMKQSWNESDDELGSEDSRQ